MKEPRFAVAVAALAGSLIVASCSGLPQAVSPEPDREAALAEARQLSDEAWELSERGRLFEAEDRAQRSLAITERLLGPDDWQVGGSLLALSLVYLLRAEFDRAGLLLDRIAAIAEKRWASDAPRLADVLLDLGKLAAHRDSPRAARFFSRALAIRERLYGTDDARVVEPLDELGATALQRGRAVEAETHFARALAIVEQAHGGEHPATAARFARLGSASWVLGRYAEAEARYRRALAIHEKTGGRDDPAVAVVLHGLGEVLGAQGRYGEAESLLWRAVAITETRPGSVGPGLPSTLEALAGLSGRMGRTDREIALYKEALPIWERRDGPDHPNVARLLSRLAGAYGGWHADEAERLLQRALDIQERALRAEHPEVAATLHRLGVLHRWRRAPAEAEVLHLRALSIREKAFGPDHPAVAESLSALALGYRDGGELDRAEPLLRRALAIWERAVGPEHPAVARAVLELAGLYEQQERWTLARAHYERGRQILLAIRQTSLALDDASRGIWQEADQKLLWRYVALLDRMAGQARADAERARAIAEAFVAAEQARGSTADAAVARAAARIGAGDPVTAALASRVQELQRRRQALAAALAQAYGTPRSRPDPAQISWLPGRIDQLERSLAAALSDLTRAVPKYGELAAPDPITLDGVEQLLRPDEALLAVATLPDALVGWLVRPVRGVVYFREPINLGDLWLLIWRVHRSLNQRDNPDLEAVQLRPFDVAGAHRLYRLLLGQVRPVLDGVRHLIVVPDQRLLLIPFGALVTSAEGEAYRRLGALYEAGRQAERLLEKAGVPLEPEELRILEKAGRRLKPEELRLLKEAGRPLGSEELRLYRELAWLARDYAITVLPAATALRGLRATPHRPAADTEPFIGFGDPLLEGDGHQRGGAMIAARGAYVSVADLRKLDRLPGTRDELLAVAAALDADPDRAIFVGADATESTVRRLDRAGRLARARVLAFATHGLTAGQLAGLAQPSLVLTPPATPTDEDDGLLSLEEILEIRLDGVEWVILSACNTAAQGEVGSAEGLSGLARAFFFAGARSLLVSHWSVDDQATQALMTEVFQRYARESDLGRAEVLRRGMLALLARADGDTAYFAHPFAWAPFFLVGDGGPARR